VSTNAATEGLGEGDGAIEADAVGDGDADATGSGDDAVSYREKYASGLATIGAPNVYANETDVPLTVAAVVLTLSHSLPVQYATYTGALGAVASVNEPLAALSVALEPLAAIVTYNNGLPVASERMRRFASALTPVGVVVLACAVTGAVVSRFSVPVEPPAVTVTDCCDAGLADGSALGLAAPLVAVEVATGAGEEPPPPPPQAARNATRAIVGQAIREKDNDDSSVR
jgi:hypothetical protein